MRGPTFQQQQIYAQPQLQPKPQQRAFTAEVTRYSKTTTTTKHEFSAARIFSRESSESLQYMGAQAPPPRRRDSIGGAVHPQRVHNNRGVFQNGVLPVGPFPGAPGSVFNTPPGSRSRSVFQERFTPNVDQDFRWVN